MYTGLNLPMPLNRLEKVHSGFAAMYQAIAVQVLPYKGAYQTVVLGISF